MISGGILPTEMLFQYSLLSLCIGVPQTRTQLLRERLES